MKGSRSIIGCAVALGLLAGSTVGATAQEEQAGVATGAESAGFVEPVGFTAVVSEGPWVSYPTCEDIGGMSRCQGEAWSPRIVEVSDQRLDGEMTLGANQHKWPGGPWLVNLTYRITNEEGAWQGSSPTTFDGDALGSASVVLVGEGAYEGLYAWMDVSDWSAISGVVFSYPPPEAPPPPSAD